MLDSTSAPDTKQTPEINKNFEFPRTLQSELDTRNELYRILRTKDVTARFQVIVDLQQTQILGFEALIRGPSDGPLHSPIKLLQAAAAHGLSVPIEHLCRRVILERYQELRLPGKLFLNVSPECLILRDARHGETLHIISELGISPSQVVIELTEYQPTHDYALLSEAVRHYRSMGFEVAIDDLGEGFSSLRLWSELKPDFVKIDMHFIQGIDKDPVKAQFVRSIHGIAKQSSTKVIAEGIETQAELESIAKLGIAFGQGYFIARPHPTPSTTISAQVIQVLGAQQAPTNLINNDTPSNCVTAFMRQPITVSSKTPISEVEHLFLQDEKLKVIPIVDQGAPIGIINRHTMIDRFARPYQRELYGRKTCTVFMEKDVIKVDHRTGIQKLSQTILDADPDQLMNGMLITQDEKYLGMASGADLLRALTSLQIEAARHANPLTQLPGNVPINQRIDELLTSHQSFIACYCDLDHFKPFNDVYGYQRGDIVIQMTGKLLLQYIDPNIDFLGHIGGDDFVLLWRSEDWEQRSKNLLNHFSREVLNFYSNEDRERGGYLAENRQGKKIFHSLISLSIGAANIESNQFQSHHQVSVVMAEAKKQAKKALGNSLFIDRRVTHQ